MANGVHLLTGHQTTNHISALEDAAVNRALTTDQNVIIANSQSVGVSSTISGTTGTFTVTPFTALFSGRKVTAAADVTATCTLPSSTTTYKHVSVGILYTKDTSNDVEDCDLAAYASSSITTDASAAKAMSTGAPSNDSIGEETTEAYFELFDLVVNANGIVSDYTEKTYAFMHGLSALWYDIQSIDTLNTWKSNILTPLTVSKLNNRNDAICAAGLSTQYDFFIVSLDYTRTSPSDYGRVTAFVLNGINYQRIPATYEGKSPSIYFNTWFETSGTTYSINIAMVDPDTVASNTALSDTNSTIIGVKIT